MINNLIRNKKKVFMYDINDIFVFEGILKQVENKSVVKVEVLTEVNDCGSYFKDNKIFFKDKNGNLLFESKLSDSHLRFVEAASAVTHLFIQTPHKIYDNRLHKRESLNLSGFLDEDFSNEIKIFDFSEKGIGFYSKQNYPEYSTFTLSHSSQTKKHNITIVRKKVIPTPNGSLYFEYGAVFQTKGIESFLRHNYNSSIPLSVF